MDFSLKILIVEKRILLLVDNCQSKNIRQLIFHINILVWIGRYSLIPFCLLGCVVESRM